MGRDVSYSFGEFKLQPADGRLWHHTTPVALTPKAFAVLEYLVARAGRLVTKQELLETLWPGVFVGDASLKVCVREVRRALGDDIRTPRFVETAHRRGYRFVASVLAEETPPPVVTRESPSTTRGRSPFDEFAPPPVRYARSGDVNIAYQVVGDGPIDLVFVMGWVSHLDYFWTEPSFARFLLRLASFSRLILFDKRGTGLSDRVVELPTLEQRMDDVRAVMDAVGSTQAALLGISEGGPMCSLFAATYPDKALALVMIGTYAKRTPDPEYPWAPSPEARQLFYREISDHWGEPVGIDIRAPSKAHDPVFREWWATYLRMGASPGAALRLTQMNTEIDVRYVLPLVRVPALVLHRSGDRCLLVEEGRYVASRIPRAKFVELPGDDHLPFVGDQDALLDEIEEFLTGMRSGVAPERALATVLSARFVHAGRNEPAAPARTSGFEAQARKEISWFRGRAIPRSGGRLLATFDGPARAIRCAAALLVIAPRFDLNLRLGLHTGECAESVSGVTGLAGDIAEALAERAMPGEALVSRTVKDLVAGSGLPFEDRGIHVLAEATGQWRVFRVVAGDGPRAGDAASVGAA